MAATGAFIVDPIMPLFIEYVPQVLFDRRRSLVLLGLWTRSTVASGRWTWSPSPLSELLLELTDELILLLDDKVLSPEIVQERVFVIVGVGLVIGLELGQDRSLALLGDRFFTSYGMLFALAGLFQWRNFSTRGYCHPPR